MFIQSKDGSLTIPRENILYFGVSKEPDGSGVYMLYAMPKSSAFHGTKGPFPTLYESINEQEVLSVQLRLLKACIKDDQLQQAIAAATPIAQIVLKEDLVDIYIVE